MSRPITRAALCLLALVFSAAAPASALAQDRLAPPARPTLLDPSHTRLTLDHATRGDLFYYQGDPYRAITQYQLHLMEQDDPEERDPVQLRIAWIYKTNKKYNAAADALRRVILARKRDDPMGVWASLYYADVARLAKQRRVSTDLYTKLITRCGTAPLSKAMPTCVEVVTAARLGLADQAASAHDFKRARKHLAAIPARSFAYDDAQKISAYVNTLDLPNKSPALAGVLSIVPGLGHFYLEEYSTGVIAMIWNGVFIYAFADAIRDRKYGYASVIGLLEFIWYGGTIFGAVSGAERFNRDARRIVEEGLRRDIEQMRREMPWSTRFPRQSADAPLQLDLKLSF